MPVDATVTAGPWSHSSVESTTVACNLFGGAPGTHKFVNRGDYEVRGSEGVYTNPKTTLIQWGGSYTEVYGQVDTCVDCAGYTRAGVAGNENHPSRICFAFSPLFTSNEVPYACWQHCEERGFDCGGGAARTADTADLSASEMHRWKVRCACGDADDTS